MKTPRDLPPVHAVLDRLRPVIVEQIRRVLDDARQTLLRDEPLSMPVEERAAAAMERLLRPSLRRVINATGVILHTNLGRAPLGPSPAVTGYSNLEYDLITGRRGKRDTHAGALLEAILGKPAIVVNNNAAALFLILNELAMGGEAIVSRGELIEIGDGFRIPEIMARSGAALKEVGTTNRTHIDDYREAITERTRVLLRVHPSNFRMTGFTSRPGLSELVNLGRERGIPVYEDLGSGCVVDLGIGEPLAQESLKAGVNVISFSGDKLLGGPQAGIVAGDAELVARIRRNPLFRALRQDKLAYRALETSLRNIVMGQLDEVPSLRMIRMTPETIRERALKLAARIPNAIVIEGQSLIGGGSTPELSLPTWLIAAGADERRLRAHNPPVIARVEDARVLLDLRTVFPEEEETLAEAVLQARS
ncbi:MAG: L-seryl-tRNA(Sec) selenium transferase [Acidobacteriota bacterium]|nr:L-seryl-tRNA(Sec) selenium transferase [Acidobacteriota bacterium]